MASRRFFGYDPYDEYYYTSPYHRYPYTYYSDHQQPTPARRASSFFQDADQYELYEDEPVVSRNAGRLFPATGFFDSYYNPAPARSAGNFLSASGNVESAAARAEVPVRPSTGASRSSVSVPVRFVSSDPEPDVVVTAPVKRVPPSAEEAAVRVQAAARGFLARRAVRALRAVEREAEEVAVKVARNAEALRGDGRARVAIGEQLMRLLLRLDAVRGAREFRKKVAKRVLALQDAVDALEQRTVDAQEEVQVQAADTAPGETAEEDAEVQAAGKGPGETAGEENAETQSAFEENGVTETAVAMEVEVEGNRAAVAEDAETNSGGDKDKPAGEETECEWEMVAEEPGAPVPAASQSPQPHQAAAEETTTRPAAAADGGGVDSKKLMEMVAALCEQSAQQCAVVAGLAERVDALERAVRRVEDAERRRRRAKKLKKEGRGAKCYSSD